MILEILFISVLTLIFLTVGAYVVSVIWFLFKLCTGIEDVKELFDILTNKE